MSITYAEQPESFRGTGTVFIAEDDGEVHGYWDGTPEHGNVPIEEMPSDLSRREAAEWGLSRTPRVMIRFEGDGYYAVDAHRDSDIASGAGGIIGSLTLTELNNH